MRSPYGRICRKSLGEAAGKNSTNDDGISVGGASVTRGIGSISSRGIGTDQHEYLVNLTGVINVQQILVTLTNVEDTNGNISGSVPGAMNVRIGDTNSSRTVNAVDSAPATIACRHKRVATVAFSGLNFGAARRIVLPRLRRKGG